MSGPSLNANTRVRVGGRQREITDRGEVSAATEAENGVTGPRGKRYWQPLGAGRRPEPVPPQGLQCPCPHLDFGPMVLISDFWPPDCQRIRFRCSKHPVCGGHSSHGNQCKDRGAKPAREGRGSKYLLGARPVLRKAVTKWVRAKRLVLALRAPAHFCAALTFRTAVRGSEGEPGPPRSSNHGCQPGSQYPLTGVARVGSCRTWACTRRIDGTKLAKSGAQMQWVDGPLVFRV